MVVLGNENDIIS